MPDLPIRRMLVYRHGVGYFERRGPITGTELRLTFPREAMDDILKSLIVLDLGEGQVLGVDIETPEDRAKQIERGSIHLSNTRSLLDLLRDLRGRNVRLQIEHERRHGDAADEVIEGAIIGIDLDEQEPLDKPLLSLYLSKQRNVRTIPVRRIAHLVILDDRAAADMAYFLRAAQSEEDRRSAIVRLSEGDHDMLVGYIAPAPSWRVSYRLLAEPKPDGNDSANGGGRSAGAQVAVLLQGWGLFDNQLDEDLESIELTLVAGMPVSFRYRLYEPHTPERPMVQDDVRTVAAPIEFQANRAIPSLMEVAPDLDEFALGEASALRMENLEQSIEAAGVGEERGALFQYRVVHPVSVARGRSAMVPIVSRRLDGRKELLYNGRKLPRHPVASLRMQNETGLTLERGPVTVVEHGDYAGEAVLPFTRAGAEMIIAYAVELGVTISEERHHQRTMAGLSIHKEYAVFEEWDVQQMRYRITSTLPDAVNIVIEQERLKGYDLFDTPAPDEEAHNVARWTVRCPSGVETVFMVNERCKRSRHEEVRKLDMHRLQSFLSDRYLDQATYRALERILSLYDQVAKRRATLQEIAQEQQKILARQQQIQANLGPLGREGSERALRERYVAQLNQLEDRLNDQLAREQETRKAIERLEQEAAQALAALSKP
ncbi:hypothetical protein [Roseiflexus castenholzii]|jgi:hypothetical protein|uniref:DUF4139 domain-containing protein n=1 Tax=Roseiflexus castenholzii (strain DSM 13941 / HLO8) TaxID=383372 RepID=A7NQQ4_ROSCS|nr:hypothetical protein [Roseiflexus castenholzii]ABU59900.1 conserved hypothetical protein [Roseiflexus castenholzii DSM 13941]